MGTALKSHEEKSRVVSFHPGNDETMFHELCLFYELCLLARAPYLDVKIIWNILYIYER